MATPILQPDFVAKVSLDTLPADADTAGILRSLRRDGAVIVKDLVTKAQLDAIDEETKHAAAAEPNVVMGLVGKSATAQQVSLNAAVREVSKAILTDYINLDQEDDYHEHQIPHLLSLSQSLSIPYGTPQQYFYRSDYIQGVGEDDLIPFDETALITVAVAATKLTGANGAGIFAVGSHRWNRDRVPEEHKLCFAEMEPGSAVIYLGSVLHANAANSTSGSTSKIYNFSYTRGNRRTEENQFMTIPRATILKMAPEMQALLGYQRTTSFLGTFEFDDPMKNLPSVFALGKA